MTASEHYNISDRQALSIKTLFLLYDFSDDIFYKHFTSQGCDNIDEASNSSGMCYLESRRSFISHSSSYLLIKKAAKHTIDVTKKNGSSVAIRNSGTVSS